LYKIPDTSGWAVSNAYLCLPDVSSSLIEKLDRASQQIPIYPYWHQVGFAERNPFPAKLDYF
jgi:hypothetical protein